MSLNKPTLLQNLFSHLGANCLSIIKLAALICRNLMLVVSATLCAWNVCVAEESSGQREAQIIAAYLYHFIKFTEWPTVSPVFHYCVYEDTNFAGLLRKTYSDKTIGTASIDIKNINAQAKLDDCQLIYFSQAAPSDFLEAVSSHAILSIGMQKDFAELGGIIYLFEEDQKLRFYVNNATASHAGLKISSQLLQLSKEP
jgi:hypothetical protein